MAMLVLMMAFMDDMRLIQQKMEVNQLARCYLLRMETVGCLREDDKEKLLSSLEELGVQEIGLGNTTMHEAGYGEPVLLEINGKLGGKYDFTEKRISTAKY